MSQNFGNGVSRTLNPTQRQFIQAIFQKGKPPLDADVNLGDQIQAESIRQAVSNLFTSSGWLIDPTEARADYQTNKDWSNFFILGNPEEDEESPVLWAAVNGWLVPVAGTVLNTEGDVRNQVRLYPPPASDARIDLVFLEVWQCVIKANPSVDNKPSSTTVWKYGNTEYGQTNLQDDFVDGVVGRETARRVQVQYRLRVFGQGAGGGSSVALDVYPEGLNDPNILGQGTASSPVTGYTYSNMRTELGDPGLWRAGDGNPNNALGTVDGYSYAIPVCAITRRNTSTFTAINLAGNPNNNGAFNRNPSAALLSNPREGAKAFTTATLVNDLEASVEGIIQINNLVGSGFDDPNLVLTNTFLKIDDEIIGIAAVNTGVNPGTITIATGGRGRGGSRDTRHSDGATVSFYNHRPDGLFADEVTNLDIVDLRHSINPGDWDYDRLLLHNLSKLVQGTLYSSYKKSATGDTQGLSVVEVSMLHADGSIANPNQTEALDGPDGIRTVFSDAATLETNVTVLLDNDAALTGGFTTDQFDSTVEWDVGADFKPTGFLNNLGNSGSWTNGSVVFLHIGGDDGTQGARATFRDGTTRAVRFVSPQEYWKSAGQDPNDGSQTPITLNFLDQYALHPLAPGEIGADAGAGTKHPGPFYPLRELDFERPFIALGGLLHPTLKIAGLDSDSVGSAAPGLVSGPNGPELDLGLDFDTAGNFYSLDANGNFADDPTLVNVPLLRGQRTLYDMITNGGRDLSGASSQIYIVLYGDTSFRENNGAFKVIGAGTVGYTSQSAQNATSVLLEPLSAGVTDFTIAAGETLTAEFRSQYCNSEDGGGFAAGNPAMAVVLTDIQGVVGGTSNPWNYDNLGGGGIDDYSIPDTIGSKLKINFTLLYHPGRGATARVPENVWRVSLLSGGPTYLRQSVSSLDSTFPANSGIPSGETFYDTANVQVWNRLGSRGLTESSQPKAPAFGGNVVAFSEQDREHEAFLDTGSKTLIFRPMQNKSMTLKALTTNASESLWGVNLYPNAVPIDGAGIFTSILKMAFALPSEFMPRFGRQDIPYYTDLTGNGSGTFLEGINHLFTDSGDPTQPVFSVIGGQDNISGGNLVNPMYFQTGSTSGHNYAVYGTIAGPATPAYQARLTTEIGTLTTEAASITNRLAAVQSSDLGAGLVGIQLPPYIGVARIYGVYDRADFIAKGGQTFGADRITPAADPPANLLRKDGKQQTLFIFRDGASDLTLSTGDHTYIIPQDAIDISLSPYFNEGTKDTFTDFEFVVEASIFGFAKNWINENNYVLARRHTGTGALVQDGDDPELEGINMTIPCAAVLNDQVYLGYSRTPYQGDPYMTRAGETRTTTDYEARYGQVTTANAYLLNSPIQQFDTNGDLQIEIPNARPLEVLASADFYTTMGTGNVGGRLFPGTPLDVGYLENSVEASSRIPASASQPAWKISPRAFTEGQKNNSKRASLTLLVNAPGGTPASNTLTIGNPVAGSTITITGLGTLTGVNGAAGVDQFSVDGDSNTIAASIVAGFNFVNSSFSDDVFAVTNNANVITLTTIGVGSDNNLISVTSNTAEIVVANPQFSGAVSYILDGAQLIIRKLDGTTVTFTGVFSISSSLPSTIDEFSVSVLTPAELAFNIAQAINRHPSLQFSVIARVEENRIILTSLVSGEQGNALKFSWLATGNSTEGSITVLAPFTDNVPFNEPGNANLTASNFFGGVDDAVNGGDGTTQINLNGMTERLPLGILCQDSDFLGENPLNDSSSAFKASGTSLRPVQSVLPLTESGDGYTRFLGGPGQSIAMSDGAILRYQGYHSATSPAGTKRFRLYRGGGAAFVLSGKNPGGPIDWASDSFPASVKPVLKGGLLACKALLVRNYREDAFATENRVSEGDEIQMVIMTHAIYGNGREQIEGINVDGVISPTGYGEGYAAADRFRLEAKPTFHGYSRKPRNPDNVTLAVFPGREET